MGPRPNGGDGAQDEVEEPFPLRQLGILGESKSAFACSPPSFILVADFSGMDLIY
jgi:hypothetical protein